MQVNRLTNITSDLSKNQTGNCSGDEEDLQVEAGCTKTATRLLHATQAGILHHLLHRTQGVLDRILVDLHDRSSQGPGPQSAYAAKLFQEAPRDAWVDVGSLGPEELSVEHRHATLVWDGLEDDNGAL